MIVPVAHDDTRTGHEMHKRQTYPANDRKGIDLKVQVQSLSCTYDQGCKKGKNDDRSLGGGQCSKPEHGLQA